MGSFSYVKIPICDALSQFNNNAWRYHALSQGIRIIKTFTVCKRCYCRLIYSKDTRSSVEYSDNCDKIKTFLLITGTQHQLLIFHQIFQIFVVKLKLLRRWIESLLLGMTEITLVLRFKTSNKFYYVQTVKDVNSKDVNDAI